MYKVHTRPNQTGITQFPQDIRKTNKHVSFSTRVILTTSVSRPQLKSNQLEDRVMHNNSQGKKQQVDDHRRNFNFSNNKIFVTVCNDNLNAKTSNVNFVFVTCGKCMLNDNHDMCILNYINGVNSKNKQPIVVPISTRKPKRTVNQSVATSLKKIVVAESTNKKPRNKIRKQYGHVSKTCRWWYSKITPPGYKWKPKNSTVNVKPNVSMPLEKNLEMLISWNPTILGNPLCPILHYLLILLQLVEIILFIVDSGCSKHMTGNLKLLTNFVKKFLDLEVVFRKSTCYIYDLKGNDLLTGSRGTDLYSMTLQNTGLHAQVRTVRTNKGTKFLNKTLHAFFAQEGIEHQMSTARTPEQNNVVERRNHTLVEAARTMLSTAKVPLFFWAEAIATTYGENLDKMKEKGDAYHVSFDPAPKCLTTALKQDSLSPGPQSQENVPYAAKTVTMSNELDLLFSLMFDELLNGTTLVVSKSSVVYAVDAPNQRQQQNITPSTSTTVDVDTSKNHKFTTYNKYQK
ncbi:retrovirus-related pol polyprotein from transposon TNT 1-94 [Tanacetum coccineum]